MVVLSKSVAKCSRKLSCILDRDERNQNRGCENDCQSLDHRRSQFRVFEILLCKDRKQKPFHPDEVSVEQLLFNFTLNCQPAESRMCFYQYLKLLTDQLVFSSDRDITVIVMKFLLSLQNSSGKPHLSANEAYDVALKTRLSTSDPQLKYFFQTPGESILPILPTTKSIEEHSSSRSKFFKSDHESIEVLESATKRRMASVLQSSKNRANIPLAAVTASSNRRAKDQEIDEGFCDDGVEVLPQQQLCLSAGNEQQPWHKTWKELDLTSNVPKTRRTWDQFGRLEPEAEMLFTTDNHCPINWLREIEYRDRSSFYEVPEHFLIVHCLNVLIAISSSTFVYQISDMDFAVRKNIKVKNLTPHALQSMLEDFAMSGTCYERLSQFCEKSRGLFLNCLSTEIRKFIRIIHGLVVQLYDVRDELTLFKLHKKTRTIRDLLMFLLKLVSTSPPQGNDLLAHIYSKTLESIGSPYYNVITHIFLRCCQPYLTLVQQWIYNGQFLDQSGHGSGVCYSLQSSSLAAASSSTTAAAETDSSNEFLITPRQDYLRRKDRSFWTNAVSLNVNTDKSNVPLFLRDYVQDVLVCGKTVLLLKICQPRHYLVSNYLVSPILTMTLDQNEVERMEESVNRYESQLETLIDADIANRLQKENEAELRKRRMQADIRNAATKEFEQMAKRFAEEKEMSKAQTLQKFVLLKQQMLDSMERKRKEAEAEKEEDSERVRLGIARDQAELDRIKAVEEQAKAELIAYYEELGATATLREQKALWRMKRRELNEKRRENLETDQNLMEEELNERGKLQAGTLTAESNTSYTEDNVDDMKSTLIGANNDTDSNETAEANTSADSSELPVIKPSDSAKGQSDHLNETNALDHVLSDENQSTLAKPSDLVVNEGTDELPHNTNTLSKMEYEVQENGDSVESNADMKDAANSNESDYSRSDHGSLLVSIDDSEVQEEKSGMFASREDVSSISNIAASEAGSRLAVVDGDEVNATTSTAVCTEKKVSSIQIVSSDSPMSNINTNTAVSVAEMRLIPSYNNSVSRATEHSSEHVHKSTIKTGISLNQDSKDILTWKETESKLNSHSKRTVDDEKDEGEALSLSWLPQPSYQPLFNYTSEYPRLLEEPSADICCRLIPNQNKEQEEEDEFSSLDVDGTKKDTMSCSDLLKLDRGHADHNHIPLAVLMKRIVIYPLQKQYRLANKCIRHLLMVENNLELHLEALRRSLLLADPEFAHGLCSKLFLILEEKQFASLDESYSHAVSMAKFSRAFNFAFEKCMWDKKEVLFERLHVRLKSEAADFLDGYQPDCFSVVNVKYRVHWPLNIIISDSCHQKYLKLFHFLVSLRRLSHTLSCLFFELKNTNSILDTTGSTQFSRIQFARHSMQHQVNVISDYVQHQLLNISYSHFINQLSNAQSVDQIYSAHADYLNSMLSRALLNEKASKVMKLIMSMFRQVISFHHHLSKGTWSLNSSNGQVHHSNYTKLNQTFSTFQNHSKFLIKIVANLAKSGFQPHLENFLLKLNFNNFYPT